MEAGAQEWADHVQEAPGDEPGSVEAFTLSSLLAHSDGKINLLKLDIEGGEREVFGPSAHEWLPAVENLVIELHDKDCLDRFFSAMEGYQFDLIREQPTWYPCLVACRNIRSPQHRTIAKR